LEARNHSQGIMVCHRITGTGYGTGRYRTGLFSNRMDTIEWTFTTGTARDFTIHIFFYCYIYTFCTNLPNYSPSFLNGDCTTREGCFPIRCDGTDRHFCQRVAGDIDHGPRFAPDFRIIACRLSFHFITSNPSYIQKKCLVRLSCVCVTRRLRCLYYIILSHCAHL
jgi:hypothetical protein